MVQCPNCGAQNDADAAFCDSCGARLEAEAPPARRPPSPDGGLHWPLFATLLVLAALAGGGAAAILLVLSGDSDSGDGATGRSARDATRVVVATTTPIAAAEPISSPEPIVAPAETPAELPTEAPPTVEPSRGYATAEEAIAAWVAPSEYAGDCSATTVEEDVGKVCSSFYGGSGSQAVYAVGPTFSEFGEWLLLEQQADGTWLVVDTSPVGTVAVPPWPVGSAPPEQYVAGYGSPDEAIAAFLGERAVGYAGDCVYADPDTDIGLYCAMLWEDRGTELIYLMGPAFSEPDTWVLLALQGEGGGWLVVDDAGFVGDVEVAEPPWP